MADDTRQASAKQNEDLSKEALNVQPENKPFTGTQWQGGKQLPYRPPENANMMAGGTEHTAGGKTPEVSLSNAFDGGLKWSDFTELPKRPCVRDALMTGIGSGFAFGGVRAIFGGTSMRIPTLSIYQEKQDQMLSRSSFSYYSCRVDIMHVGSRFLLSRRPGHVPILSLQATGGEGRDDAGGGDFEQEGYGEEGSGGEEGKGTGRTASAEGDGAGCAVCGVERGEAEYGIAGWQQALVEDMVIDCKIFSRLFASVLFNDATAALFERFDPIKSTSQEPVVEV